MVAFAAQALRGTDRTSSAASHALQMYDILLEMIVVMCAETDGNAAAPAISTSTGVDLTKFFKQTPEQLRALRAKTVLHQILDSILKHADLPRVGATGGQLSFMSTPTSTTSPASAASTSLSTVGAGSNPLQDKVALTAKRANTQWLKEHDIHRTETEFKELCTRVTCDTNEGRITCDLRDHPTCTGHKVTMKGSTPDLSNWLKFLKGHTWPSTVVTASIATAAGSTPPTTIHAALVANTAVATDTAVASVSTGGASKRKADRSGTTDSDVDASSSATASSSKKAKAKIVNPAGIAN